MGKLVELVGGVAWFQKSSAFLLDNQLENKTVQRSYLQEQAILLNS